MIKIKNIRKRANITQSCVAKLMGVTERTIRNWENGTVKMGTADAKLYWEIIEGKYPVRGESGR